jgi:AAA+ ATPase superfamily predicted ATPase
VSGVLVPLEPRFVDRASELAEFDSLLEALSHGRRRHLARLGLRRIGKTMLLDEVRRRHPEAAIMYLALDEVVSTPEELARALVAETVRVAAGRSGKTLTPGLSDDGLRSASAALGADVLAAVDGLLGLARPGAQNPPRTALSSRRPCASPPWSRKRSIYPSC